MDNSTISLLRALDYGSAKQQAIANNMSNVNTPGYKRKDVPFTSLMQDAEDSFDTLSMRKSNPRHMDAGETDPLTPTIVTDSSGSMRLDGNNVDIDVEAGRLAETQIFYQGAAQLLQSHYSAIKYVISGGK